MSHQVGDPVRVIATPSQTGVVHRCNPLAIVKAVVIEWNDGPTYSAGEMMGYFGDNFDLLEGYTP